MAIPVYGRLPVAAPELAARHGVRRRERRLSARLRDRRQQQPVLPDRGYRHRHHERRHLSRVTTPATASSAGPMFPASFCRVPTGLPTSPTTTATSTDGSPQVGDICVNSTCGCCRPGRRSRATGAPSWSLASTRAACGYYALDVTDPLPSGVKVLWEFTNRGVCYTDARDCRRRQDFGLPPRPVLRQPDHRQAQVRRQSGWCSSPPATTTPQAAATARATSTFWRPHTGKILQPPHHRRRQRIASPSGLAQDQRLGDERQYRQHGARGLRRRPRGQPVALPARLDRARLPAA